MVEISVIMRPRSIDRVIKRDREDNTHPVSRSNPKKVLTKEANHNSKLLNSCDSSGDSVSPVEAKRSRKKDETVMKKINQIESGDFYLKNDYGSEDMNSEECECKQEQCQTASHP